MTLLLCLIIVRLMWISIVTVHTMIIVCVGILASKSKSTFAIAYHSIKPHQIPRSPYQMRYEMYRMTYRRNREQCLQHSTYPQRQRMSSLSHIHNSHHIPNYKKFLLWDMSWTLTLSISHTKLLYYLLGTWLKIRDRRTYQKNGA